MRLEADKALLQQEVEQERHTSQTLLDQLQQRQGVRWHTRWWQRGVVICKFSGAFALRPPCLVDLDAGRNALVQPHDGERVGERRVVRPGWLVDDLHPVMEVQSNTQE